MNRRKTILIVDDNRSNRLALRTILKGVDAELHEAGNGFDALSMSLEEDYAMILLDVQMPEMDGYEVCEQLRLNPKTANIPVIFLTAAFREDEDKIRGYLSGATDYLAKPVEDYILRAKVQVFLRLYTQNHLLQESESRIRAMLDTALDAVIGMDDQGRITDWNQRAVATFGWTKDEALGCALDDKIIPPQHREAHRRGLARFLATAGSKFVSRRIELTALRRNGEEFPVDLGITPLKTGDKHHFTAFIADITVRKRAEDEIRRYVAKIETAFMSAVEMATTLSEMRDSFTAGHERRVSEIAVAIGAEIGFDERLQQGLRVAGLLYDVGKITIPADILSKPGKLSSIEFRLIQGHAQSSYEILKNVQFPWPVAEVALQHHERMDGSGYPQGLKGEEILLESRIMAVADVVEAMSSHRPYRAALGIDQALAEIECGRGALYDPIVADACLKLFREKSYAIPA